jgi:hypothetical protein
MSAIGGSIRKGELVGSAPIRHALKLVVWARYLFFDQSTKRGFRWPAQNHDGYADAKTYAGQLPDLQMGSLLTLPTSATADGLGLTTPGGRKIFQALQDYGAYIVDDAAWDSVSFAAEVGVKQEFNAAYGYGMDGDTNNPFARDVDAMVKALEIVTNSAPQSIGGGGTPRAPLAPPFKGQSAPTSTYRIMALGDSITMADPGYRGVLQDRLTANGYRFEFVGTQSSSVGKHEGHGGFTIGPDGSRYCYSAEPNLACTSSWNLFDHLEEWLAVNPDVVLLLIGVNDSFPTTRQSGSVGVERPVNPAEAPDKLERLVERIVELKPQAHIFVASLLPTDFAANLNPDLNDRAKTLGERSSTDRVYFVDMNREAGLAQGDWSDGLHPNDSGNQKVASLWARAIETLLPK